MKIIECVKKIGPMEHETQVLVDTDEIVERCTFKGPTSLMDSNNYVNVIVDAYNAGKRGEPLEVVSTEDLKHWK